MAILRRISVMDFTLFVARSYIVLRYVIWLGAAMDVACRDVASFLWSLSFSYSFGGAFLHIPLIRNVFGRLSGCGRLILANTPLKKHPQHNPSLQDHNLYVIRMLIMDNTHLTTSTTKPITTRPHSPSY